MCCTMCTEKSESASVSIGGSKATRIVARPARKSGVRQRRSRRSRLPTGAAAPTADVEHDHDGDDDEGRLDRHRSRSEQVEEEEGDGAEAGDE